MERHALAINITGHYKVYRYQNIMMRKRGYILPEVAVRILDSPPLESLSIFQSLTLSSKGSIDEKLCGVYQHKNDIKDKVKVIYIETLPSENKIKKEKKDQLLSVIERDTEITKHFILISKVNFTVGSYKELKDLPIYRIEFFLHEELFYDPTVHVYLQPKFELFNRQVSEQLLSRLKKDASALLKTCYDDPVSRFLGAMPGQIMRVTRKNIFNSEADESTEFRIVINTSISEDRKKEKKIY